ncbi:MAG: hypothetical protein IT372_42145 [Polyangiaceae bacterium]|nr:hypothetical protein [Polyangiaceae bacterium]
MPADATQLSYTRGPGAEACPDEQGLRDVVAAQLGGADPFAPAGPPGAGTTGARRMDVAVSRESALYKATIVLYGPGGERLGARDLAGPTCAAVIEDVSTTISVALRPFLSSPAPAPSSVPVPAPAPPAAPPPAPRPPEPPAPAPRSGPRVQVAAMALLAGGFAPALSVGFAGGVGVRWAAASISLEGRGDLPASGDASRGTTVRTSLLAGSVVPCLHHAWFFGCGLVSAGRMSAAAGPDLEPEAEAAAYTALGGRLGAELELSPRLAGQVVTDLLFPIARPTIRVGGERSWATAVVSELAGVRLVASF